MNAPAVEELDFSKSDGLIPAIVQDNQTNRVLMLGYMNQEAYLQTVASELATFYSRSRQSLWTKGETSGNYIKVKSILLDCDKDTLLVRARPKGTVCHTGTDTCWGEKNKANALFLRKLENTLRDRKENPKPGSHTSEMFAKGINKIAQKLGEEAVELVIEAKDDDKTLFLEESADLLYRFTCLLVAKGYRLEEVMAVLEKRHK